MLVTCFSSLAGGAAFLGSSVPVKFSQAVPPPQEFRLAIIITSEYFYRELVATRGYSEHISGSAQGVAIHVHIHEALH
jgi:hypothetical protein